MDQRTLRIIGGGLIFLAVLWMVASAVFWRRMPTIYQATARFTAADNSNSYDTNYLQKQFDKIQSPLVLGQVITNLQLDRKWRDSFEPATKFQEDSTYQMLKQRLHVRQTRSTTLIEVHLRSQDAIEAAQIANEIAKVYQQTSLLEEQRHAAGQTLTAAKLPRGAVEIVDPAVPPLRPVSPPSPLVGLLNLVPGFGLVIGGLLMLATSRNISAVEPQ